MKGWYGNKQKHAMASKGIRSSDDFLLSKSQEEQAFITKTMTPCVKCGEWVNKHHISDSGLCNICNRMARGKRWNPDKVANDILEALPDEKFLREQMKQLEGETAYWYDAGMHEIEVEIGDVVNIYKGIVRVYDGYQQGGYDIKLSDLYFEKEDY